MTDIKKYRAKEALMHAAAEFIAQESNRTSLVTVTNIEVTNREKNVCVFVTVLPIEQSNAVIDFLSRRGNDMREFLKKKVSLRVLPYFTFKIDTGEKNRQKIDEIIYKEEQRTDK